MRSLLKNGYKPKLRPSGHDISNKFGTDNKASIPPNIIALPNTESNSFYLRYCKEHGLHPHPARFPAELPEYFIRMLTDQGDLVLDPFAGSCVTAEVAERLKRRWLCCDLVEDYLKGALARFKSAKALFPDMGKVRNTSYKLYHPSTMWGGSDDQPLPADGGKSRRNGQAITCPASETIATAVREKGGLGKAERGKKKMIKKNHLHTRI
jgi:site-specific DNA-methyltransferase (cytosine-N4-specific)